MTEAEWLKCTDPRAMISSLQGTVSRRRVRLFYCAVCRRNWSNLGKQAFRDGVEVAERFADGKANDEERHAAWNATGYRSFQRAHFSQVPILALVHRALQPDEDLPAAPFLKTTPKAGTQQWLCQLVREIFGHPSRPIVLDPFWVTPTVKALAQGLYDARRFQDLWILADALEEAGCTNLDILNHCRQAGEHVPGCWAVDLVLGKS
jgi:hypothetical protein